MTRFYEMYNYLRLFYYAFLNKFSLVLFESDRSLNSRCY